MEFKTQKAKGIIGLATHPPTVFKATMVKKVKVYPQQAVEAFPFFARPCPKVPRHGFVESRMIEDPLQWEALLAEIKASGETEAEVVMMPYIHCQFSGVLTPSGISYGPGNDGVTGGQAARAIPAAIPSKKDLCKLFNLEAAAEVAGITESPYLEFVESNGELEGVQLRNGPAVPLAPFYVPHEMTVQQVVSPTEAEAKELLLWEKRMIELKGQAGVVVWYPGGSMHSHVAVQAIEQTKGTAHPFAVWLQETAPKVGEVLQAANSVPALTEPQLAELGNMLASAISSLSLEQDREQEQAIRLAVAALHASPFWNGDRHLLVLRAVAIAAMLKFASAAILGELRHWNSSGPGRAKVIRRTTVLDEQERTCKLSRDQVYERAFRLHISLVAPRMGTAYRDFMTKGWSGAYGGKNWGACTEQTINLFNAVSAFIFTRKLEHWQQVMSAWNGTVNVFHNTGKFLNKFISSSVMDQLAKGPVLGLTNAMVGRLTVHDEDFPMHRNPERVAGELHVIIPKAEKAKKIKPKEILVDPSEQVFDVRWRMKNVNTLYLQIKLPVAITKEYGASLELSIPSKVIARALKTAVLKDTSMAGTGSPYGKGVVKMIENEWVLLVPQNGLWVRVNNSSMAWVLGSLKAKVEQPDEIGDPLE